MKDRILDRLPLLLVCVGLLGLFYVAWLGKETSDKVAAGSQSQLLNRAFNVEQWCGGINKGREYNRDFVRHVTQGRVAYTLDDLPCEEIIRKTLESPKHHTSLSAHPETARVAKKLGLK